MYEHLLFSPVPGVEEVVFSSREGMTFSVIEPEHDRGKNSGAEHTKDIVGRHKL